MEATATKCFLGALGWALSKIKCTRRSTDEISTFGAFQVSAPQCHRQTGGCPRDPQQSLPHQTLHEPLPSYTFCKKRCRWRCGPLLYRTTQGGMEFRRSQLQRPAQREATSEVRPACTINVFTHRKRLHMNQASKPPLHKWRQCIWPAAWTPLLVFQASWHSWECSPSTSFLGCLPTMGCFRL